MVLFPQHPFALLEEQHPFYKLVFADIYSDDSLLFKLYALTNAHMHLIQSAEQTVTNTLSKQNPNTSSTKYPISIPLSK